MSPEGTPLHFAAQCGNVGMMEVLLKYNANVFFLLFILCMLFLVNIHYVLYVLLSMIKRSRGK
jgi:ankyrin repeat protein